MSKLFKLSFVVLGLALFFGGIFSFGFVLKNKTENAHAASTVAYTLKGYMWAPNIGAISMGEGDVVVNPDNTVTGFGWSPNIGWVKFGGLSGFPSGNGTTPANATFSNNVFSGWIRACAGMYDISLNQTAPNNTCTGSSRTDGWDGWISLKGSTYGISNTGTAGPVPGSTKLSGYAWGADVVGWVEMANVYLIPGEDPCTLPGNACAPGGTVTPVVTITTSGQCNITISWSSTTNTTEYSLSRSGVGEIYRGLNTTYIDATAVKGTSYTYTVTPYNGSVAGTPGSQTYSVPSNCAVVKVYSPQSSPIIESFSAKYNDTTKSCAMTWNNIQNMDLDRPGNMCTITGKSSSVLLDFSSTTPLTTGSISDTGVSASTRYTITCTNTASSNNTAVLRATCPAGMGITEI